MTAVLEGKRAIVTLIGAEEEELALTPLTSMEPVSSGFNGATVVKEKDCIAVFPVGPSQVTLPS